MLNPEICHPLLQPREHIKYKSQSARVHLALKLTAFVVAIDVGIEVAIKDGLITILLS